MENQYNYYNPNEMNGNYQYGGYGTNSQPEPEKPDKKKKTGKSVPKAVAVGGLAILFGVVSSAVFLTSNVVGTRLLGLDSGTSSVSTSSKTVGNSTPLSTSSSVVTSDVSGIVENVMPSIVSITSMSVEEVQSFFGGTYQQQRGHRNYYRPE